MSITHDEAGNDFHAVALGLRPTRPIVNYRDASGGTGGAWQKNPTPIPHPGRQGQNPWGNGRLKSSDGKAATSSSSQRAPKRQKLDHRRGDAPSKYFSKLSSEPRTRGQRAQAGLSSSPSRLARAAEAIVIDEDDSSDAGESSSKPVTLKTSSPDPMDIITPETAYTFDQSKPSPIDQFSSSLEELHRSPTDGESTARLRTLRQTAARNPFRPNGDSQSAKAPVSLIIGQADRPPGMGHVGRLVSVYEEHTTPRIDLQAQHRKRNMKPRQPQRQVEKLPITLQDPYATRSGKTTRKGVVCSLPLDRWSIGVDIHPHEATYPPANLIWDQNGLLKVQHADSSTLFELCFNKKSFGSLQYVDLKVGNFPSGRICLLRSRSFLHLRCPSSRFSHWGRSTIESSATNGFKLGSHDANGLLTFKFDPDASDWDLKLYGELVRDLQRAVVSKDGKSVLDRPGAKAVWEAVMRAREDRPTRDRIESLPPDNHPKEVPDSVKKPRARPKPRTEVAPVFDIVRRSARLSGVEQQRFSPKPDPDEVILAYRSGAGSLNITNGDVSRLKPGEFLNDTLIEFGLKLWLADLHESNPELATQVHVFSSFFYKKLSTKVPEEGYNSVRKWTSKFDLFQKKYIIVPINENMHWYLAIICFPEYTLLPRPKQVANIRRRSTRQSGGADFSSVKDLEPTSKQSPPPPPHPDPPSSAQADSATPSGLITPVSPRTDDQREEIDVERMVESGGPLPELSAKQNDEHVQVVDKDAPVDDATGLEDSLTLLYPGSSPHVQRSELLSLDQQVDVIEQEEHPASISVSEGGSTRDSGIAPTTFYGQSDHRRQNVTSPEISPVDNGPPVDIVVEEDVIMANPDSEHEEAVEHSQTYIFTFDSLSSKHPQAVKRLGKYLLMEAHDKKQRDEDTLTEPKGMQAHVSQQPNHCDCGVYLLHFAKTFMKDPKLSSEIIQNRSSPQKGRRVHEHWDDRLVVHYRDELAARIHLLSDEWKQQRSEQDAAAAKAKSQTEAAAAPQEQQSSTDQTPAASSKADNDSDSEIEVLVSPKKATTSKATSRRYGGLADYSKRGAAARMRGG
ncbi:hypothetical protein EDB83DRAFT_2339768 [Lactarius deliciosus]|nr:hypothetical protein EDB83DRAFT_2339768 [Lactarius deliciosus]